MAPLTSPPQWSLLSTSPSLSLLITSPLLSLIIWCYPLDTKRNDLVIRNRYVFNYPSALNRHPLKLISKRQTVLWPVEYATLAHMIMCVFSLWHRVVSARRNYIWINEGLSSPRNVLCLCSVQIYIWFTLSAVLLIYLVGNCNRYPVIVTTSAHFSKSWLFLHWYPINFHNILFVTFKIPLCNKKEWMT